VNLLAILAALGLEQWHSPGWRLSIERMFLRQAHSLERSFNGGKAMQGAAAAALAIVPPVAAAGLAWWALDALHPLAGLAFNVLVLYALMGFRRFSHAVSAIVAAFKEGDLDAARRALGAWRGRTSAELGSGDVARLAIERGLIDAYRQVFAVLFWFAVLPGPIGAILYRLTARLAQEWAPPRPGADLTPIARERAAFGAPAGRALAFLDWVPSRLTAIAFAAVGDFEDAVASWRTKKVAARSASCSPAARAHWAWCSAVRCRLPQASRSGGPTSARAIRSSPRCFRRRWGWSGAPWCCGSASSCS
jgi:adenosylcobinamide-phosphate synthase